MVAAVEEPSALPPLLMGGGGADVSGDGRLPNSFGAAGPSGADVVVVPSDEESTPPPPSGDHDVAMTSVSEPSPAVKVPETSLAAEVPEPSLAAGAVETSSPAGTMIVEEVMELATGRYIDFLKGS
jgi:hypothetical protein